MIYVFYGTEEYLMDREIAQIIKTHQIDEFSTIQYNLENTIIENIIEDASMPSLFGNYKMIVVENAYIFTGSTKRGLLEQNINALEDYRKNLNENTFLVFKVLSEKLDERKKIVKLVKKNCTVKEMNGVINIKLFVKTLFDDYKIDDSSLDLFIDRVGNHLLLLENEAEKIKLYKYDEKEIIKEDIIALTSKTIDINIFTFIDNIIYNRKEAAIETYDELIKLNEEPIAIVVMLANQFRIMYQSKELSQQGYTEKSIAEVLNIHPYRVKKALEKANRYSSEILLNYLCKLRDVDFEIKSGKIEKSLALELFILGI